PWPHHRTNPTLVALRPPKVRLATIYVAESTFTPTGRPNVGLATSTRRRPPTRYAYEPMRRARVIAALTTATITVLAFAAPALATSHSGEGWYGETNDVEITNAMYLATIF